MVVVAPGVGGNDAAARVVTHLWGQVVLVVVDAQHDHGGERLLACLGQQRRAAPLRHVARQVLHLACAAGGQPGLEEGRVRRVADGDNAAVAKA